MIVLTARNINDAWKAAKILLAANHVERPSRVGPVWEAPEPVTTVYLRPCERVLFDPVRDANPFFHFFEGLWMLAGRQDVTTIAQFNQRIASYSDDGVHFHGAYGYRWRQYFDMEGGAEPGFPDQLNAIVRMLRKSHDERRAVLAAWDPVSDLERPDLKDLPCNTHLYFLIRNGHLTMTVCCRSNDIIWGCYGANVVHMSMLQEYLAARIGVPVGAYYQVSNSWHAYVERWQQYVVGDGTQDPNINIAAYTKLPIWPSKCGGQKADTDAVTPYHMVTVPEAWDDDLQAWFNGDDPNGMVNPFFPQVAARLLQAWYSYKQDDWVRAMHYVSLCAASDWALAAQLWLLRRQQSKRHKAELALEST